MKAKDEKKMGISCSFVCFPFLFFIYFFLHVHGRPRGSVVNRSVTSKNSEGWTVVCNLDDATRFGIFPHTTPYTAKTSCRGYTEFDFTVEEMKGWLKKGGVLEQNQK